MKNPKGGGRVATTPPNPERGLILVTFLYTRKYSIGIKIVRQVYLVMSKIHTSQCYTPKDREVGDGLWVGLALQENLCKNILGKFF